MSAVVRELLARGVDALRRSAAWWSVGIVALVMITAASWPSLEGSDALGQMEQDLGSLLEAFGASDLASPAGYLDGQLYALMLPLLLSAMAIINTSGLTSGDEDAGRLELLHALPVGRRTVWLSRLGAATLVLFGVSVVAAAAMISVRSVFSLEEVGVGRIAGATLGSALLAAFHAAVAFAAGGLGASRGRAAGVAALVLVASYVMTFIAPLTSALEGIRAWSPWHWALGQQPVSDGINLTTTVLILATTVAVVAVGTFAVNRRDIRSA